MNTLSSITTNFVLNLSRVLIAGVFAASFAVASNAIAANPENSIADSPSSLININEASPALLAHGLKGIGPSKAEAIVRYREKHGAFRTVEELVNVKGIGPKTLEKLRAQIVAGEFNEPEEGESLAEQEAAARETVQALVKRSLEIRKTAATRQ